MYKKKGFNLRHNISIFHSRGTKIEIILQNYFCILVRLINDTMNFFISNLHGNILIIYYFNINRENYYYEYFTF